MAFTCASSKRARQLHYFTGDAAADQYDGNVTPISASIGMKGMQLTGHVRYGSGTLHNSPTTAIWLRAHRLASMTIVNSPKTSVGTRLGFLAREGFLWTSSWWRVAPPEFESAGGRVARRSVEHGLAH